MNDIENKLTFSTDQAAVKRGLPKSLKYALVSAIAISSLTVSCRESDDCTTTTTDTGSVADLGAQQDPNTFCDND